MTKNRGYVNDGEVNREDVTLNLNKPYPKEQRQGGQLKGFG